MLKPSTVPRGAAVRPPPRAPRSTAVPHNGAETIALVRSSSLPMLVERELERMIFITSMCFNLMSDGLRQAMPSSERAGVDAEVLAAYDRSLDTFAGLGAQIVDLSLPRSFRDYGASSGRIMPTALHPQTQLTLGFGDAILPPEYGFPMRPSVKLVLSSPFTNLGNVISVV